ncbi:MAG: ABC-2 type transport system ATP-binding protein [Saprospiraceae bacterium]|jgi:ABC-2 type transport system ATP-binding protein
MSIKVQNISKFYGKQTALNDVSFEIKKGEIVGFLGPNGAGKSTMMKIICAYLSANKGEVLVCEKNVSDEEQEIKKLIGYLPEHNPLYLDMYVKEFLNFMCGVHRLENKKEKITNVINLTGLQNEQHKKIKALSKGYRQRVGLAHAIIHDPEVLILDEPTTGLDPNQIIEIRELIQKIGKEKTVMLSTHIMQEVEAICKRVIIIDKGVIVANQDIDELKSKNQNIFIEVEFENSIDEKLLQELPNIISLKKTGETLYVIESDNDSIRSAISKFSLDQDNGIIRLNKQEATLEQVFQNLTK